MFVERFSNKEYLNDVVTFATGVGSGSAGLTRMVGKDLDQQFVRSLFVLIDDGVVQWVLVLLQPTGDVVRYLIETDNNKF